jgi:hypothetical protein
MLLMKAAALMAWTHINRGAPEKTIPKEAMTVILPIYPSAKFI